MHPVSIPSLHIAPRPCRKAASLGTSTRAAVIRGTAQSPPRARRRSHDAREGAREMRLIAHPSLERYLCERGSRIRHETPAEQHSRSHYVLSWRLSEGMAEQSNEVTDTELDQSCESRGADARRQMRFDVGTNEFPLPGGQFTLPPRYLSRFHYMPPAIDFGYRSGLRAPQPVRAGGPR
jgi:hypothetical protein